MKRIIFILLLSIGVGSMAHAQLFKVLKTKAKTAVDNSVDRSTSKVVDKTINNPADNITDTVLTKAGKKLQSIFKKKDTKNKITDDTLQIRVPQTDSIAIKSPNQNQ
ncbi:MAG: hypothetical protein ABJA78_04675 [Ferruginibacter sp.]